MFDTAIPLSLAKKVSAVRPERRPLRLVDRRSFGSLVSTERRGDFDA